MHIRNGADEFTDFLDPKSIGIFLSELKKHRVEPIIYGGYATSERNMMGFCDDASSFPILPVLITYDARFSSPPAHRNYLGSLIGLGLDRGKLGDICIIKSRAIVHAHNSTVEFLIENLKKVGKTSVKTTINDKISTRGYGRVEIESIVGISKKGKIALNIKC